MSQNRTGSDFAANKSAGSQSETTETGATGVGTGAALREEQPAAPKDATQNVLSETSEAAAPDPSHTEEVRTGAFGPFRYWMNKQIRGRDMTINHAGEKWNIVELTMDGELRLEREGGFVMVPLDERYIPQFLDQLPILG